MNQVCFNKYNLWDHQKKMNIVLKGKFDASQTEIYLIKTQNVSTNIFKSQILKNQSTKSNQFGNTFSYP